MAASRKVVIAIDFGTTYSGYAFSLAEDPKKISTGNSWSTKLHSSKVPTSVLLNSEGEFHSFGYDAEEKYSNLALDMKEAGWGLFTQFKMSLYNNEKLSKETKIKDITEKISKPAFTIVTMALGYIADHAKRTVKSRKETADIDERDMFFVITVPAIWSDEAKQFMRKAAVSAGLPEPNVRLVLESEAASIWCQAQQTSYTCISTLGSRYMVVDIGGGTTDITVHEKRADGTLQELQTAGDEWGGTQVNKAFLKILKESLGKETMKLFKDECISDYLELLGVFEIVKRTIGSTERNEQFKVRLPHAINAMKKQATEKSITKSFIASFKKLSGIQGNPGVVIQKDKIRLNMDRAKKMFQYSVQGLCEEIRLILEETYDLNSILVVGGFSESPIVREAIGKQIEGKDISLIFPFDPGLTVLRGAVLYGHNPKVIYSRKAKFTYGLKASVPFDKNVHSLSDPYIKTEIKDGQQLCINHFQVLIKEDYDIKNEERIVITQEPFRKEDQLRIEFELFISTNDSVSNNDDDNDDNNNTNNDDNDNDDDDDYEDDDDRDNDDDDARNNKDNDVNNKNINNDKK
ncbi:Heat shock 70 kDa protein 12A [Mactra antiquata]